MAVHLEVGPARGLIEGSEAFRFLAPLGITMALSKAT